MHFEIKFGSFSSGIDRFGGPIPWLSQGGLCNTRSGNFFRNLQKIWRIPSFRLFVQINFLETKKSAAGVGLKFLSGFVFCFLEGRIVLYFWTTFFRVPAGSPWFGLHTGLKRAIWEPCFCRFWTFRTLRSSVSILLKNAIPNFVSFAVFDHFTWIIWARFRYCLEKYSLLFNEACHFT